MTGAIFEGHDLSSKTYVQNQDLSNVYDYTYNLTLL